MFSWGSLHRFFATNNIAISDYLSQQSSGDMVSPYPLSISPTTMTPRRCWARIWAGSWLVQAASRAPDRFPAGRRTLGRATAFPNIAALLQQLIYIFDNLPIWNAFCHGLHAWLGTALRARDVLVVNTNSFCTVLGQRLPPYAAACPRCVSKQHKTTAATAAAHPAAILCYWQTAGVWAYASCCFLWECCGMTTNEKESCVCSLCILI